MTVVKEGVWKKQSSQSSHSRHSKAKFVLNFYFPNIFSLNYFSINIIFFIYYHAIVAIVSARKTVGKKGKIDRIAKQDQSQSLFITKA